MKDRRFLKALSENSLTSLNFPNQSINIIGMQALSEILAGNTSLTSLTIDNANNTGMEEFNISVVLEAFHHAFNNTLGFFGAKALGEALIKNTSLTSFNFCGSEIGSKGAKEIAKALLINNSLTSLSLDRNNIDDRGVPTLRLVLRRNTSLTKLSLAHNKISDIGATEIAESLLENISLTSLSLKDNNIETEGAKAFSEALNFNTSLTDLQLDSNNIGEEGIHFFIKVLEYNNTSLTQLGLGPKEGSYDLTLPNNLCERNKQLQELSVSENFLQELNFNSFIMTELALGRLLLSLQDKCLYHLELSNCRIDDKGLELLLKYLAENPPLSVLNLSRNPIALKKWGSTGKKIHAPFFFKVREALKNNRNLKQLDLSCTEITFDHKDFALIKEAVGKESELVINVSGNYLSKYRTYEDKTPKKISKLVTAFFKESPFYHSECTPISSCFSNIEPGLKLFDPKTRHIALCSKKTYSGDHAWVLIEGMHHNGQAFLLCCDLTNRSGTKDVIINMDSSFCPHRFKKGLENDKFYVRLFPYQNKKNVNHLIQTIQIQSEENSFEYKKNLFFAKSNSTYDHDKKTMNCMSWAVDLLKMYEILSEEEAEILKGSFGLYMPSNISNLEEKNNCLVM